MNSMSTQAPTTTAAHKQLRNKRTLVAGQRLRG